MNSSERGHGFRKYSARELCALFGSPPLAERTELRTRTLLPFEACRYGPTLGSNGSAAVKPFEPPGGAWPARLNARLLWFWVSSGSDGFGTGLAPTTLGQLSY